MTPDDEDDDDGGRHDLTLFHRRGTVNRCVYARTSRMLLAVFTWDRRHAQQCDTSVATTMRFYPAIRIFFQLPPVAHNLQKPDRGVITRARRYDVTTSTYTDTTETDATRRDDDDSTRLLCTRRVHTISP